MPWFESFHSMINLANNRLLYCHVYRTLVPLLDVGKTRFMSCLQIPLQDLNIVHAYGRDNIIFLQIYTETYLDGSILYFIDTFPRSVFRHFIKCPNDISSTENSTINIK